MVDIKLKAISWCIKNNIKVYIKPLRNIKEVKVEINNKGQLITSPKLYKNQRIASEKVWDLYIYLYKKYNK
jgi:hypothetical protein